MIKIRISIFIWLNFDFLFLIHRLSYITLGTVLKMMKLKLNFIKKWLKKKDAPEYVYMFRTSFILQKKIMFDPKKRKNTANFDIYWIMTNFLQLFTFFRVKNILFCKKKKIRNMYSGASFLLKQFFDMKF